MARTEPVERHADELAGRIAALGSRATGTDRNTSRPRMPHDAVTGREYVEVIADCLAIEAYADAGFDHVYVHQIGPDQAGFARFYEEEVLRPFEGG